MGDPGRDWEIDWRQPASAASESGWLHASGGSPPAASIWPPCSSHNERRRPATPDGCTARRTPRDCRNALAESARSNPRGGERPVAARAESGRSRRHSTTMSNWFGLICALGEYLAGHDGHLVIAAALSQYPDRLNVFLKTGGWSWVQYCDDRFTVNEGTIPKILELYFRPKDEVKSDWSEWMTRIRLSVVLNISRNKPFDVWCTRNRKHVETNNQKPPRFRVRLSILSSEMQKRLREDELREYERRRKKKS